MSKQENGVDALSELDALFNEAAEALASERLNETSRLCFKAAQICCRAPTARDGWIRQSAEVRQWMKEGRDFDKADADRQIAKFAAEQEAKKQRAAKRAAMRKQKRGGLKVV